MNIQETHVSFDFRRAILTSICLWTLTLLAMLLAGLHASETDQPVGNRINPLLDVKIDRPILRLAEPPAETKTDLTALTYQFPANASLTYSWKQIQDELSPLAVKMSEKHIHFSATNAEHIEATLPGWGVYEVRVTVTDAVNNISLSRNAWINVWNNRSNLLINGKPDPLTFAPGILPPPSVRHLSPDPGPFAHPRLLCTPMDWTEIHDRCVKGTSKLAACSYDKLTKDTSAFFKEGSPERKLADDLEAFAARGFSGPAPDLLMGETDPKKGKDLIFKYTDKLRDAALLQWLQIDPSTPWAKLKPEEQTACRRLARITAAFCHVYLANLWTPGSSPSEPGVFHKDFPSFPENFETPGKSLGVRTDAFNLALAYDFLAPWMTAREQLLSRNLLFAFGPDRATYYGYGGKEPRGVARGMQQNGTFSNMTEEVVACSLAVAGEESGADPSVLRTFLLPTTPDAGPANDPKDPWPEAIAWPDARKCDVRNLMREIFIIQDSAVTPWGFMDEREAYFTFYSTGVFQYAIMFARRGANDQYITGNIYQAINNPIYFNYPYGPVKTSKVMNLTSPFRDVDHHSGNGDFRNAHTRLWKYMYPDDPAVDLVAAMRSGMMEETPFMGCLFNIDPTLTSLKGAYETVAKAKGLPLTKIDPQLPEVVLRSDWSDEPMYADMEPGGIGGGHATCEKNSFSLFALGRSWSTSPGFHKEFSNWYAGIQFQYQPWAGCPITQGYVGMHPNYPAQVPDGEKRHLRTGPTRFVGAWEGPGQLWSLAAGDATDCYCYGLAGNDVPDSERTSIPMANYLYPGLLPDMISRCPLWKDLLVDGKNPYYGFVDKPFYRCPITEVQFAIRNLLMVRGKRPYVLVIDDFKHSDKPSNYRWMMNNSEHTGTNWAGNLSEGPFSMMLAKGASPTEGVLLHLEDVGDKPGLPRLLVRDVSETDNSRQPMMHMDQTQFQPPNGSVDHYLKYQPNRLFIERNNVVEPKYKVLLFPFRTGDRLPVTRWNDKKTKLTIDLQNGTVDTISFDSSNPDHRTRISIRRTSSGTVMESK